MMTIFFVCRIWYLMGSWKPGSASKILPISKYYFIITLFLTIFTLNLTLDLNVDFMCATMR